MSHAWVSLPILYPAELAAIEDQPPPVPNDRPAVWDLVIADMRERDALVDAYQESLDKTAYLRQAIEERREIVAFLQELAEGLEAGSKRQRRAAEMVAKLGGSR